MEGLYQVEFLGRKRDVYFGMPAVEYVFTKIDFSVFQKVQDGSFQAKDMKNIAHFVYAGIMGGCDRNDEAQDFTYADVYTAIDKAIKASGLGNITSIVGKAFAEGLPDHLKPVKKKVEAESLIAV